MSFNILTSSRSLGCIFCYPRGGLAFSNEFENCFVSSKINRKRSGQNQHSISDSEWNFIFRFLLCLYNTSTPFYYHQFDLESRKFFLTRLKSQYDKSTRTIYQTFFPLEKQKRHYFAHAKITPKNTNLEVWIINHIYW